VSVQYCPHCGTALDDPSAKFCPNCGASVDVAVTPTKEVTPPPPPPPTEVPPLPSPQALVEYAGFWERLLAFILDVIIIGIVSWIGFFAIIGSAMDYFGLSGLFSWIGKIALKLRTVDEYSLEPATPGNLVINNLSRGFWGIILDFLIGILANRGDVQKRLRILQNLSKTVVIKTT